MLARSAKNVYKMCITKVKDQVCFPLWRLLLLRSDTPGVSVRLVRSGPMGRERRGILISVSSPDQSSVVCQPSERKDVTKIFPRAEVCPLSRCSRLT